MLQPKAVIRPTALVEIPLQTQRNYGFNTAIYPPVSHDHKNISSQSSLAWSQESYPRQRPEQSFVDGSFEAQQQQQQHVQYHPSNFTPEKDVPERQVLTSQVVIVQSGRQNQSNYPVQPMSTNNYPRQVPNVANKKTNYPVTQGNIPGPPPPMIVQPGIKKNFFSLVFL